jgi:hypothetical protein
VKEVTSNDEYQNFGMRTYLLTAVAAALLLLPADVTCVSDRTRANEFLLLGTEFAEL